MTEISLNGKWNLYREGCKEPIPGIVPGTVFYDLMENGIMEDPFYRDNEKIAREFSFQDYVYERKFDLKEEFLDNEKIELCCEGLDTLTEIYINDRLVGKTDNMFRLYELDVKKVLQAGENNIRIKFLSPSRYASEKHAQKELFQFEYAMPGMGHIRKAHYMFGWDWGPQLPDMGIYRPISLKAYKTGKITDVWFQQEHQEGKVELTVRLQAEIWSEDMSALAQITAPDGTSCTEKLEWNKSTEGEGRIFILNPQLWWPHGHGEQPLYKVDIILQKNGEETDRKHYQLGLRTMELIQEEDQWGRSFEMKVNGVPIYLKGGDYIPEDNILARCNRERTKKLLKQCVECNHNAIRVWGGGLYPEEYFFDLCDELGLVVWQDLMFACATYDSDNKEFLETTLEEIRYNIGRIRHRACLGLICGNNEMELAHVEWEMKDREENKKKYHDLFEIRLPKLAKKTAPNVAYWLASPTSGGEFQDPNNENYGDMHYWGVWHQCEPFEAYRKINPRFMSEFGIQSFPCLKTLETCTEPEDRNIFSRVMELHQKGGSEGNARILNYVSQLYRYPKNFESLLFISQMIQAEGIRWGVEHWRRIYGRCMGAIYWQLNDCWPVASWASIDSMGRWKALQYFSKKFFASVLVSAEDSDKKVSVWITNDLNKSAGLELKWRLCKFNGSTVQNGQLSVEIGKSMAKEVLKLDFADVVKTEEDEANHVVELELYQNGTLISENKVYFAPVKYMKLQKPEIHTEIKRTEDGFELTFKADTLVKALWVDFKEYDFILSDNFFDLIPEKKKTVLLSKEQAGNISAEELREQLKLMSIVDTYD